MKIRNIVGLLLVQFAICTFVFAAENVEEAIKSVVVTNMEACQKEDTSGMMDTIHSQSMGYLETKQAMQPIFENFDLKYTMLSYKFIIQDGEYAIARVRQRTEKVSGPAFQNNELDMIQIFKKEGNAWKYWSQAILEVNYI